MLLLDEDEVVDDEDVPLTWWWWPFVPLRPLELAMAAERAQ